MTKINNNNGRDQKPNSYSQLELKPLRPFSFWAFFWASIRTVIWAVLLTKSSALASQGESSCLARLNAKQNAIADANITALIKASNDELELTIDVMRNTQAANEPPDQNWLQHAFGESLQIKEFSYQNPINQALVSQDSTHYSATLNTKPTSLGMKHFQFSLAEALMLANGPSFKLRPTNSSGPNQALIIKYTLIFPTTSSDELLILRSPDDFVLEGHCLSSAVSKTTENTKLHFEYFYNPLTEKLNNTSGQDGHFERALSASNWLFALQGLDIDTFSHQRSSGLVPASHQIHLKLQQGLFSEAEELASTLLFQTELNSQTEQNAELWYLLGMAQALNNKSSQAQKNINKALKLGYRP